MTAEELKHEMYEQLAAIRKARKHPIMLRNFEDDLEAYLDALRQEHGDTLVNLDHANRMTEVYSEAYNGQQMRTRFALAESRELTDALRALRGSYEELEYVHDLDHEKLQEAIAKLASASLSLIALHRVIKTQQAAQDRLQRGLDEAIEKINADRFAAKAEQLEWELAYGELEGRNDAKQDLIIEQREAIKTLVFELANARKAAVKPSFWSFLARKKHQAKPLPKKTN